jgi:glycosyltransferase involved in cell wall biosynthesis
MHFSIISSCMHAWGGSEELWAEAALNLKRAGHQVTILKTVLDERHARVRQLRAAGCAVDQLRQQVPVHKRMLNRFLPYGWQWASEQGQMTHFQQHVRRGKPDLVVAAQGANFDGIAFADSCRRSNQPYVLLSQKAADIFLPPWQMREQARLAYTAAQHCYFVSRHNLELTQSQLGLRLDKTTVVPNPFNVPYDDPLPWPVPTAEVQLACVARLEILDKGQDLLLEVLALPKWRARPVHVTFFGQGGDEPALRQQADFLNIGHRISWAGQVANIAPVWAMCQALVLPSRFEGLPLALVEAMLCGRPAVATAAGGTAELLDDNRTGFLAAAATVPALDEALERAWVRQADWPAMGRAAAARAMAHVPADPGAAFSQQLLALLNPTY